MFEKVLGKLKTIDSQVIHIILCYVVITVPTTIFASCIFYTNYGIIFYISFLCLLISIIFVYYFLYYQSKLKRFVINSIIVYDPVDKKIIPVDMYIFSYYYWMYITYLFNENNIDKNIFIDDSLDKITSDYDLHKSVKAINDLTEYTLLTILSYIVNAHYTKIYTTDVISKYIKVYNMNDVYSLFSKNIFFDTFTRPTGRRNFSKEVSDQSDLKFAIDNNLLYENFELFLPKDAKLIKPNDRTIVIKTNDLTLNISYNFKCDQHNDYEGLRLFSKFYIKEPNWEQYIFYNIKVVLETKLRFTYVFRSLRNRKYDWLDKYCSYLTRELDFNNFLESINWKTNKTNIIINYKKINFSDLKIQSFVYELCKQEKYELLIEYSEYIIKNFPDITNDTSRYSTILVNLALAYKYSGNHIKATEIINDTLFNDNEDHFKLAKLIILDKIDEAFKLLNEDEELKITLKKNNFKEWPLFKAVKNDSRFIQFAQCCETVKDNLNIIVKKN